MTCSVSANILTATIKSTLINTSDYVIKLQILDGITNPPSCYSDNFLIYTYNSNNEEKDSNYDVIVNYTPNTITSI